MCTYQDTSGRSFSTVGDLDWLSPPAKVNYMGGLLDPTTGMPNPSQVYGWDVKAPGAVDITLIAGQATAPDYDMFMKDTARAMGVPEARLRPHLAIHMVQTAFRAGRDMAGLWEDGSQDIAGKNAFWSIAEKPHTVRLHVMKGIDPTPVEAIDRLAYLWAQGGLTLASKDIQSVVSDHSVCTQDRTSCLATTCELCLDDTVLRGEDLTKIERDCSSFFSGGPLEKDGERYDCAVRLGGGVTATSADGDGVKFGRVEVKNGNTWGTICSTGWDDTDANVLCKSIGYESGTAKTVATNCHETERTDWCLTAPATGGTKAIASVDAAANTITIAATCTADDPSTTGVENTGDAELTARCAAVDGSSAAASTSCLGVEMCAETAAGSTASNPADAAACAQVPLTNGRDYGTQCTAVGTARTCSGTPNPARGICHGWASMADGDQHCFTNTDSGTCTGDCTWVAAPTCEQTFAASMSCSGSITCKAANSDTMTKTSCAVAGITMSPCTYAFHERTRDRGDWLTGTVFWDGTPMPDCPPGCTYSDDDAYSGSVDWNFQSTLGPVGASPSACTHTPLSGCVFTTAAGSCTETAQIPVAADTAACSAVIDPTSDIVASCVEATAGDDAADADNCLAVTALHNNMACNAVLKMDSAGCTAAQTNSPLGTDSNSAMDANLQGHSCNDQDDIDNNGCVPQWPNACQTGPLSGDGNNNLQACTHTPAQTARQVCEAVDTSDTNDGAAKACTYKDGVAAAITVGQTLSLAGANGKTCGATPGGTGLLVSAVSGAVVTVTTDITSAGSNPKDNCVLTATECEATSEGRIDYSQLTKAAGSSCNLKIIARAGLFGPESRWQLDPHLDGPTGGFSTDMEETTTIFDFLTPGVHSLKVTDTGKNGWQPLWERDLVPLYPECEEFWKYQAGDCRLCVATKPAATCAGSPAGINCAAVFAAAPTKEATSCPTGCTFVSPYTQCKEDCQTCASPCTGNSDRETCAAMTWNSKGNQAGRRCAAYAYNFDTWEYGPSTDAAEHAACATADLSGPDPGDPYGQVGMSCMEHGWRTGQECQYEPATNMCEFDDDGGCQDYDPCAYAEDGVCDIGAAGDYRCMDGDWQDCKNARLCDIAKGKTCNEHLDSIGADTTAGSIKIFGRKCTDANNVPCGDYSDPGCTCVDAAAMFEQWIHEGMTNDPVANQWSYQVDVTCGSCPGNKYFPGGLGCDMQGALDDTRWSCSGTAGCSDAFASVDATSRLKYPSTDTTNGDRWLPQGTTAGTNGCPTTCLYERIGVDAGTSSCNNAAHTGSSSSNPADEVSCNQATDCGPSNDEQCAWGYHTTAVPEKVWGSSEAPTTASARVSGACTPERLADPNSPPSEWGVLDWSFSPAQRETACAASDAGRCVWAASADPNSHSGGNCEDCRTKVTDGSQADRTAAQCANHDQCGWTSGHMDSMSCAVHSSDPAGGVSNDACVTAATTWGGCCASTVATLTCTGTALDRAEICDMDASTTHAGTDLCPAGCATTQTCLDVGGDQDVCLYTSKGYCNPVELEVPGTAAVSWRGSGGTCPCMPAWTETTCSAPYGQGEMGTPVWLADVHCTGSENSLCECKQAQEDADTIEWGAGLWLCDNQHSLDAGVECFGTQQAQPDLIKDCDGVCVPASVQGDGWCDEGEFNARMNCQQLECDGGDCSVGCQPAPTKCAAGKWACDNGVCIDGSQRCDNIPQCGGGDKSDEKHCGDVFCCSDGTNCIPSAWRNDGWPDCLDGSDEAGLQEYNKANWNFNNLYCRGVLPMCDLYMQDRDLSCSDTILPADGCPPQKWGDGVCDDRCGTARCNYDGGDCPVGLDMLNCHFKQSDGLYGPTVGDERMACASVTTQAPCVSEPQCSWRETNSSGVVTGACEDGPMDFWYNGRCDMAFNVSACNFDNGECMKCSWADEGHDCDPDWEGDGFCDWDCHTANCNYDDGDCPSVIEAPAAGSCPASADYLGDGICDRFFNTEECGCDLVSRLDACCFAALLLCCFAACCSLLAARCSLPAGCSMLHAPCLLLAPVQKSTRLLADSQQPAAPAAFRVTARSKHPMIPTTTQSLGRTTTRRVVA